MRQMMSKLCLEKDKKVRTICFRSFLRKIPCCCLILNDLTLNDCLSIMMRDKINNPSITPKSNAG